MKLSNLSKEEKQKIILVTLLSIVGLVVAVTLVFQPLRRKWSAARSEYDRLTAELDQAAQLLKQELQIQEDLETQRTKMVHIVEDCIPDPENSLSWVTQRVYQYARKAGVDIRSVSAGSDRSSPLGKKDEARTFSMFEVHVMVQCTYADLLGFIEEMETRNPYVCVSGLIVSGQPATPESHNASINLQWPVWADLETAEKAREQIGGDHG